jgi:murein DD-endopeptidase MepM/ murein hydrolase activator NlpD
VNPRDRFSLLIVRGDGARVARVTVSRRAVMSGLSTFGVIVLAMLAVVGDYVRVRELALDVHRSSAQLAQSMSLERRLTDLREETAAWHELHARFRDVLGPAIDVSSRFPGIGGALAAALPPSGDSGRHEIDQLTEDVKGEGERLRALEVLIARAGKLLAALPTRWPVRGDVNSEFGTRPSPWSRGREFHAGIDIGAPQSTPVHAPAPGTVEFAGEHPEYGLTVVIDHGQDIRTVYGHLSQIAGRQGQKIERGGLVGRIGTTGRSSGPHLHYEILVRGHAVNPRAYLWD